MKRFLLLLLFLTASCRPLAPERMDPPTVPATYATQAPQSAMQIRQRWWRDFNDSELDALQNRLFSSNLSLRQAIHRLEQLEAAQRINRAGRLPTFNLTGSLGRSQSVTAAGESVASSGSLSLAAGYEIDLWKKLANTEQAARYRTLAGQADIEALLLSLSAQLSEQYFLAIEQRAQLALLTRQADNSQELLHLVTDRYRSGLATAAEVYQARQNLAVIKAREPAYRTSLIQAENAIAVMLGQPPRSINIVRKDLPGVPQAIALGLPADLLTRRPDVSAALFELEAADRDLAAALAERLPTLDLSAALGRSTTRLAAGDYSGTFWSLALGLLQPLYDGGRLQALSDQQKAARAEQAALTAETILSAVEEVESALTAELHTAETANLLEQRRRINQDNLDLLRTNYLRGLSDSSDLLSSAIDHLDIRSQQISTQRQWLSRRITLVRALGGSWMTAELDKQRQALINK